MNHTRSIRGPEARNAQNDHIIGTALVARRAVGKLAARGFTVLSFQVEGRNPVIWIQQAPLCRELRGASKVRRSTPSGAEQIMAAPFEGCQVQWIARG